MIKIKIRNRENLTMLAKAYMSNLLPRADAGDVYYSYDSRGEIEFIYFNSNAYYFSLLEYINKNNADFLNSNASREWINLFSALSEHEDIVNPDFGFLEHYELSNSNYNIREIDNEFLSNLHLFEESRSFYRDMKRLYKGNSITYWGHEKNVVIQIDFSCEINFKFNLKPLMELISKHRLVIEEFEIQRLSSRGCLEIRTCVSTPKKVLPNIT